MSKKNVVSSIVIGSILFLIIGGGIFLLNNNDNKQNMDMLELVNKYTNNNEYEKALGILEALSSGDKDNKELNNLIKSVKEKEREFNQNNIRKNIEAEEEQLLDRIEDLIDGLKSALEANEVRVAEILRDEILRIDPNNSQVKILEDKIEEQKQELIDSQERVNTLFKDIQSAIKNRNPETLKDGVDKVTKEITKALDNNLKDDIILLQDELNMLEPDNAILSEVNDILNESEVESAELKDTLLDFESEVDDILENTLNKTLEEKLEDFNYEEDLVDQAKNLLDEKKWDQSRLILDEVLKLDPNNPIAKRYVDIIDDAESAFTKTLKAEDLFNKSKKLIEDDKIDEAKELIDAGLILDPDNKNLNYLNNLIDGDIKTVKNAIEAFVLLDEAEKLLKDNNKSDAKKVIDRAKQLDQNNLEINHLETLLKLDDIKLKDTLTSEDLVSESKDLLKNKKSDEAKKLLKDALSLNPNNDEAKTLLGQIEISESKIEVKLKADKIVEEAKVALKNKDNKKALALLENALEIDPQNQLALSLKELINGSDDNIDKVLKAEDIVKKSLDELDNNNNLEAKILMNEALELDPNNITANRLKKIFDSEENGNIQTDLDKKINDALEAEELLKEAEQLILDNDLDNAENLIDEAMVLDPDNINGDRLKNIIEESKSDSLVSEDKLNQEASLLIDDTPLELSTEIEEEIELEDSEDFFNEESQAVSALETNEKQIEELNETLENKIESTEPSIDDLIIQAAVFEKNSQYDKQLEVLTQILEKDPTASFYVKAGIASYKTTLYKQAESYFKQAIELDSDYPGIYYPMALTYEKLGDPELREKMLNIGLKLRPNHGASNYELGRFYTSKGLHIEALELFLNAQKINENSLKYKLGVALAYYNLKEFEKSIKIYEDINTQNSGISEVYYNLSMAREKVGQLDQAFDDISKAIEIKPNVPSYLYTIGEISEALGLTEQAASYYLDALKLDITYYKPMLNLGNIYDKLGRYQDSVSLLERALKLNPKDQNAKFSLGTAYLHNKQYVKSITLLKDTYDADTKSTVKLYTLALAYTEIGDIEAAEDSFLSVIKMDSKFYDAYYYLGQLLYSADRIEESRTFFNKVLELNPNYKYKDTILELP